MRDPIPSTKPELIVMIQSQMLMLARVVTDPKAYVKWLNRAGPAQVGDLGVLTVPELRALAWENANKIVELILSR